MIESFLLVQQSSSSPGAFGALFLPFALVVAIFYFLIIRPTRKRQKSMDELLSSLKNGDKVVTSGGIHGTIAGIKEDTFVLKVASQVKIEVTKNAVTSLQS